MPQVSTESRAQFFAQLCEEIRRRSPEDGSALLEEKRCGEVVERHRAESQEPVQRVALAQRDVVAQERIPVSELINPNEVRHGLRQGLRVMGEHFFGD